MICGAVGYVDHWAHVLLILHVSNHLNLSAKGKTHQKSSQARRLDSHSDIQRSGRTLNKGGVGRETKRVSPLLQTTSDAKSTTCNPQKVLFTCILSK